MALHRWGKDWQAWIAREPQYADESVSADRDIIEALPGW